MGEKTEKVAEKAESAVDKKEKDCKECSAKHNGAKVELGGATWIRGNSIVILAVLCGALLVGAGFNYWAANDLRNNWPPRLNSTSLFSYRDGDGEVAQDNEESETDTYICDESTPDDYTAVTCARKLAQDTVSEVANIANDTTTYAEARAYCIRATIFLVGFMISLAGLMLYVLNTRRILK